MATVGQESELDQFDPTDKTFCFNIESLIGITAFRYWYRNDVHFGRLHGKFLKAKHKK